MSDYIIRATAAEGMVRAFAAVTTEMVESARNVHDLSPVATAALGRTITAGAIMSQMLKGAKDTLTIQIRGDGPLGGIITVSDSQANVRGYVYNKDVSLPLNEAGKLNVSEAIGKNGYLNVIKDFGLKEPYIGYVKLISGEIAEDIAYYYVCSEQIPSVVSLGVLMDKDGSVAHSGGFFIQLMPDADEGIISYLEDKIASLPPITAMLAEGKNPEAILELLLGEKDLKLSDTVHCKYVCNCSRERMERNILSLGRADLVEILEEQHEIEVECHFCNTKYKFSEQEIYELIDSKSE